MVQRDSVFINMPRCHQIPDVITVTLVLITVTKTCLCLLLSVTKTRKAHRVRPPLRYQVRHDIVPSETTECQIMSIMLDLLSCYLSIRVQMERFCRKTAGHADVPPQVDMGWKVAEKPHVSSHRSLCWLDTKVCKIIAWCCSNLKV